MWTHYLVAFVLAMLPFVELRGALPYALVSGLPLSLAFPLILLGNLLPVPFIYFLAQGFLRWGQHQAYIGGFCYYVLQKGERAGERLQRRAGRRGLFWALLFFVGIPLPGTGAWTGTLAAALLDLDSHTTFWGVGLGVLLAGLLFALFGGFLRLLF